MSSDPLRLPLELDLFEGPLDLLLTLVLRDEVDLGELPVAAVVQASLDPDEPWDPPTAGELMVLMAALVDLKSRRLVGENEDDLEPDPEAEDVRERLVQKLVAYAPYQRAADWLRSRDGIDGAVHYRRISLGGIPPAPATGTRAQLAAMMADVVRELPTPSLAHLNTGRVNVTEIITRIRAALATQPQVSFEAQLEASGDPSPLREGTTLLAALELAHRGEATLAQRERFGDITIARARRPA